MPVYEGVVTVAEDDIPVVVELGDDVVRLTASGREIGTWRKEECEIRHVGDSIFAIDAEDETLRFVPSQPSLFAAALNGGLSTSETPAPPTVASPSESSGAMMEAPPPKPVTMGLFYALCVVTAGLAVWSMISLIF